MTITKLFAAGPAWAMHNPVGRQLFAIAYQAATGNKVCASCPSQLYQAYFTLKTILNTHFMQTNQRYKLKPGIMLLDANQTPYTARNITDEIAANLIAQNPALAAYFEETLPPAAGLAAPDASQGEELNAPINVPERDEDEQLPS